MKEKYMKFAIIEAEKAFEEDEVPIGAVIVKNNQIIALAHNIKEKEKNPLCHAEIIAIDRACKKIGDWRLDGCEMYVTVEPCLMCCGAILHSRMSKVYYGVSNSKFGYAESIEKILNNPKNNHTVQVESEICVDECKKIIKKFFESKRK